MGNSMVSSEIGNTSSHLDASKIPNTLFLEELIGYEEFSDAYSHVAKIFDFSQHPYFEWMAATDKQSFADSQIPFRHAVEGFSCALAATLAKIPEFVRRVKLAENVAEEHGLVGSKIAHIQTITEFLTVMGVSESQIDVPCPPGVYAFNQSIRNYCLTNSPEAGAAMLGIIELVFITISKVISTHIVSSGWTHEGSQRHYEVHEILDVEHSQVLFNISKYHWRRDFNRKDIGQGMMLGAYYFWDLYNTLLYHSNKFKKPVRR